MQTIREPYLQCLAHRGTIRGATIKDVTTHAVLCRYFGGLRYALPPLSRWRRARPLPPNYLYGTAEQPGEHDSEEGVVGCPNVSSDGGSEDCFQCNIWVPCVGQCPLEGQFKKINCS